MRITFLGHVGLFVETQHGSVLCDPWFTPAYFGSWFPFPRNDGLDLEPLRTPDYLYLSHLHRDHFDRAFLAGVDKRARVLLPDFEVPYLERELRDLGFTSFVQTRHGEPVDLDGLSVTIFAMNQPADGPLGDSAIVLADGTARILDQNDARPGDVAALQAPGPYDAHFVQFSGAIWYPIAYDFAPEDRDRLARDKRANQMHRARQYVEWIGAAHVFPCAGPPCFLDEELWHLNDFDRDDANIFPDQTVFLDLLEAHGIDRGQLVVPGSVVELHDGRSDVSHPVDGSALRAPFEDKRAYLERYRDDWRAWLASERASWSHGDIDLVDALHTWFEPLLAAAPVTSAGIAGNVVFVFDHGDGDEDGDEEEGIVIDFVDSAVRRWKGEDSVYRVDIDRRLVEACVERHLEDWVNSLFLSCRFRAHRDGSFNEYVMTFFKALSPERIAYVEQCYAAQRPRDEYFERDGWHIERWCPHRQADLTRFGEISDGVLTCALHHWQFDLATGRCLTSDDHRPLRSRRND
ncbi:MAG: UDP-MurNAc hydroxylase [Actinomycetota bacterium]|nr:UDP-MurNAc hydroxylase [Actinomycetota bacterium]